jgi:hypothetical protein
MLVAAPRAAEAAWRLGLHVVAPGNARDLVACVQDEVERWSGDADQALDPALERAVNHGARL